jgi:hypothetical protein
MSEIQQIKKDKKEKKISKRKSFDDDDAVLVPISTLRKRQKEDTSDASNTELASPSAAVPVKQPSSSFGDQPDRSKTANEVDIEIQADDHDGEDSASSSLGEEAEQEYYEEGEIPEEIINASGQTKTFGKLTVNYSTDTIKPVVLKSLEPAAVREFKEFVEQKTTNGQTIVRHKHMLKHVDDSISSSFEAFAILQPSLLSETEAEAYHDMTHDRFFDVMKLVYGENFSSVITPATTLKSCRSSWTFATRIVLSRWRRRLAKLTITKVTQMNTTERLSSLMSKSFKLA